MYSIDSGNMISTNKQPTSSGQQAFSIMHPNFFGTMEIVEFSIWIFLDLEIFYIVNKIRNCRSHCVLCMTSQLLV